MDAIFMTNSIYDYYIYSLLDFYSLKNKNMVPSFRENKFKKKC